MRLLCMLTPECQSWLDALNVNGSTQPARFLEQIADDLAFFARELDWTRIRAPEAVHGEERSYILARVGQEGPALYLVSDGVGVVSHPHEHKTWAVIVGLRGTERNVLYEVISHQDRRVRGIRARDIGAGDRIVLDEAAIHATKVVGPRATFHLHLYGRPLDTLPPFEDRVFRDQGTQEPPSLEGGVNEGPPDCR